jgi:hypothetical protein
MRRALHKPGPATVSSPGCTRGTMARQWDRNHAESTCRSINPDASESAIHRVSEPPVFYLPARFANQRARPPPGPVVNSLTVAGSATRPVESLHPEPACPPPMRPAFHNCRCTTCLLFCKATIPAAIPPPMEVSVETRLHSTYRCRQLSEYKN